MNKKALLAAAAMFALTACAGQQVGTAAKTPADSTEFDNALSAGYLRLAQAEYAEGDYIDSDYFALQSMAAGDPQKVVAVPEPTTRELPQADAIYVQTAYTELTEVLDAGARVKVPQLAASAQIAYECWIQELEENDQPEHIAACRDQLDGLIPALRNAIAEAPKPKPAKGKLFKVMFATGSANLDAAANATIADAAAHARNFNPVQVVVSGYTDTSGSAAANKQLSDRRAAAVTAALRARGVAANAIRTRGYGEEFPDVRTGDGVAEAKNRRVEISVAPNQR